MILHVMGFKYSGSSALVDALVDQSGAIGVGGGYPDETALFSPGRPHSPLRYFARNPDEIDLLAVLALITEGRIGLESSRHRGKVASFISQGQAANRSVNFHNFPRLGEEEFLDLASHEDVVEPLSRGLFEPYFRLIARIVRASFSDERLVVLDNDPPAHHFWLQNFVEDSSIIAVRRASRDVIVDRKNFDGIKGAKRSAEIIVKTAQLERLTRSIADWEVKAANFEDLVSNASYRRSLLRSIGCNYPEERENFFRPAESLQNIGIYRERMSLADNLAWGLGKIAGKLSPSRSEDEALRRFWASN